MPGAGRAPHLRRAGRRQQPRCHRCVRRRGHRLRAYPRRDRGHPDGGGHRRAWRRARRGGDGRGAGCRQRRQRHRLCRAGEGARAPRHRCARGARAGPPRPAPAFRSKGPLRTTGQGLRETGARRRAGRDRLAARYGGGAPGGPRAARSHDGGGFGPRRACLRQAEGGEDGGQVVRPRRAGRGARPARRFDTAPDRRRHGSARAGGECGVESARAGARLSGDDHLQGQGRDRRRRSPRRRLLHRDLGRCALPRPGRPLDLLRPRSGGAAPRALALRGTNSRPRGSRRLRLSGCADGSADGCPRPLCVGPNGERAAGELVGAGDRRDPQPASRRPRHDRARRAHGRGRGDGGAPRRPGRGTDHRRFRCAHVLGHGPLASGRAQ